MAHRILLLGTSLALETVRAALVEAPGVDLRRAAALTAHGAVWPGALPPEAVIFDLTAGLPSGALGVLEAYESVLLLGLDLEGQAAVAFSAEPVRISTVADLIRVLAPAPAS